ncbi:hypothetical protein FA15DRAFT_630667 [Coprinopsis marcescibilis]|uniref:Uncharacterized protein n=1 Tax=Coprinopsis marcescibilis TaxID=230819 RepID=A0A5C3LBC7_COPMA|nr:hypothetical protein FA15DRAFT_630667 [Coprinopsis marcescibilis]
MHLLHKPNPEIGLIVVKDILPQAPPPGPYSAPLAPQGVPSLAWFCINQLYQHPDQLHVLAFRLNYRNEFNDIDLNNLDPRLWATLVQLYDRLPSRLSTYEIPLNDIHLPLLQQIPSTSLFSMVTVLDLPSCTNLDDQTVVDLKALHSLVALDASGTSLTPAGIQTLANTLFPSGEQEAVGHQGPWPLRILCLRNCQHMTNEVNTACNNISSLPSGFEAEGPPLLFHPTPLIEVLGHLHQLNPALFSSANPYHLYIQRLNHKPTSIKPSTSKENTVVTLQWSSNSIRLDNADQIERRVSVREDEQRHARNKDAWYERQESELARPAPSTLRPSKRASFSGPTSFASLPSTISPFRTQPAFSTNQRKPPSLSIPSAPQKQKPRTVRPASPRRQFHNPKQQASSAPVTAMPHAMKKVFTTAFRKADTQTTSAVFGASQMLFRDPPPWCALEDAVREMRSNQLKRKETMKISVMMRNAEFASVARDGARASLAKWQMDNLLARREQLHSDFGLSTSAPATSQEPSRNPFKKRERVEVLLDTSTASKKPLKPISAVQAPVFTQDLLDNSAKDAGATLKRSAPTSTAAVSAPSKRRTLVSRKSEPLAKAPPNFDWSSWGKGPS